MKKSVLIKIGGTKEKTIQYDSDTMISIGVQSNGPFVSKDINPFVLHLSAMKKGAKYTFLNFEDTPFAESDSISINFGKSSDNIIEPIEIREHDDIPTCSFCKKDKNQVEYLFEKDQITYLCSECVESSHQQLMRLRQNQKP